MATPAVNIGTGATITFGTSSFTAQITNISLSGVSREVLDTSNLSTPIAGSGKFGSKTFLAGDLVDPGSVTIEGHLNPDTVVPIEGASETITITFPVSTGAPTAAKWVFPGQVISFDATVPLEELMSFTMEIKAVGPIVVTAGGA